MVVSPAVFDSYITTLYKVAFAQPLPKRANKMRICVRRSTTEKSNYGIAIGCACAPIGTPPSRCLIQR